MPNSRFALHGKRPSLIHGLCAFCASNSRFMRLFQAALDTCLDSPLFASLAVHGLHFTVYALSNFGPFRVRFGPFRVRFGPFRVHFGSVSGPFQVLRGVGVASGRGASVREKNITILAITRGEAHLLSVFFCSIARKYGQEGLDPLISEVKIYKSPKYQNCLIGEFFRYLGGISLSAGSSPTIFVRRRLLN